MKKNNMKIKIFTAFLVLTFLSLIALPAPASARWVDRSDELPGMQSKKDTQKQVVTILGVTAVLATIFYLAKKNKTKQENKMIYQPKEESKNRPISFFPIIKKGKDKTDYGFEINTVLAKW